MTFAESWKRRIARLMVFVLLFTPVLRISAEELPEPTEEVLQTEVPVETDPAEETTAPEETEAQEETQVTEATEVPEETEIPEETQTFEEPEAQEEPEPTEETLPEEAVAVWSSRPVVLTVAEVLAKSSGEDTLILEGTVVFVSERQAVLQDDTGGIRLAFGSPPEIGLGDILLLSGHRSSGGFIVTEFEKTGTGELPAREATLAEGKTALRILVKGAVLGYNTLTQNSYSSQMVGDVPSGIDVGNRVDAWGVMLDGIFYVDTMRLSESQQPDEPEPEEWDSDWNFYFGQLHAHTDISDGHGTVQEAFEFAAQVENLDFFAVTDHSNSFDNADLGAVDLDGTAISEAWAAGKAAAEAVTNGDFVGIFGYEMTWPEDLAIGHISTFGTPGWQTRDQTGMNTLKGYFNTLASVPESLSQFNHPGAYYGDFQNFSEYGPQYDTCVHLLEVGGEGDFTAYDAYTTALDASWHLAPSNNQNNHNGNWGSDSNARTVILAKTLTEEAIYDAIRNYRVYATEDADLKILYHLNHRIMGSTMPEAATLTESQRLSVRSV